MTSVRLQHQIAFARELDKLKEVTRQTYLLSESRRENDAEHSWNLAMLVLLLHEYAPAPGIDVARTVSMVLLHDVVEIDAGDAYCYDEDARRRHAELERAAAERLFGMLPADQADEFRGLWDEFEARATPEARFAAALDRFQPLLNNLFTGGRSWREHGVRAPEVLTANAHMQEGAPALWAFVRELIQEAVDRGELAP